MLREILFRLPDYKDLQRAAKACKRVEMLLSEEQQIWKQLCKYHFDVLEREWAFKRAPPTAKVYDDAESGKINWLNTFHVLRKYDC